VYLHKLLLLLRFSSAENVLAAAFTSTSCDSTFLYTSAEALPRECSFKAGTDYWCIGSSSQASAWMVGGAASPCTAQYVECILSPTGDSWSQVFEVPYPSSVCYNGGFIPNTSAHCAPCVYPSPSPSLTTSVTVSASSGAVVPSQSKSVTTTGSHSALYSHTVSPQSRSSTPTISARAETRSRTVSATPTASALPPSDCAPGVATRSCITFEPAVAPDGRCWCPKFGPQATFALSIGYLTVPGLFVGSTRQLISANGTVPGPAIGRFEIVVVRSTCRKV
jgi:hypothetical protein